MHDNHYEVFLHGQDSIIVSGLTRAQVGRYAKRTKGHDVVIEVKPVSSKAVEGKYGVQYAAAVKMNTLAITPSNKTPYVNEAMDYETEDYKYYEVKFVGVDETDIIIASSLEHAKADMENIYGDEIMSVTPIDPKELVSTDPLDPVDNHQTNISILSGRNPYLEEKRGLWDNIHAKRERIKRGSGEKMRKPGSKGAPSNADLKNSQSESASPFRKKIDSLKEGEPMIKPRTVRNPQNKDLDEDRNPIMEGEDKLMYLARIGLMDKSEVAILRRAIAAKRSNEPLSVKNRDILLKLMERLVQLVTRHTHMFNQARRKVMEEVVNEVEDRIVSEMWNNLMDYFAEAGYMDPPKTSAEVKKKFPDNNTDVKNKDSIDLQPVRYK